MNSKISSIILVLIVLLVFPIAFFLYFDYKYKHTPTMETLKCLPIYGPKIPHNYKDENGKLKTDTLYHHIPEFSFLSQNGDTVSRLQMNNRVCVVSYFFTSCKTICIDMTKNLKTIQEHFFNDENLLIISHTVDPETDNVTQLRKYGIENDINSKKWLLLTGDKKALYKQAREGYFISATQGDGGENDFIHADKLVLIDKEGRIRGFYSGTEAQRVDLLINDINKLIGSYYVPLKSNKKKNKK